MRDCLTVQPLNPRSELGSGEHSRGGGFYRNCARLKRSAALHYQGQSYELTVSVPEGPIDADMIAHLEEAFGEEHERTYGHRAGTEEPVELVAIQLVRLGLTRRRRDAAARNVEPHGNRSSRMPAKPISARSTAGSTPLC